MHDVACLMHQYKYQLPKGFRGQKCRSSWESRNMQKHICQTPIFPSWEAYGSLLVYFQLPFNTLAPGRLQASSAQIPAQSPRPGWHIGAAPAGHHLASARPFWGPGNHRWPTWSLGWTAQARLARGTQHGRSREMMSCFEQCPNFFFQHFLPQIRDQPDITWWSSESPKASPSSPSLPPGGCHSAPPFPSGPTNPRRPWCQTADPLGVLGPSTATWSNKDAKHGFISKSIQEMSKAWTIITHNNHNMFNLCVYIYIYV